MPSLVNLFARQFVSQWYGSERHLNSLNDISFASIAIGERINWIWTATWLVIDTPNVKAVIAGEESYRLKSILRFYRPPRILLPFPLTVIAGSEALGASAPAMAPVAKVSVRATFWNTFIMACNAARGDKLLGTDKRQRLVDISKSDEKGELRSEGVNSAMKPRTSDVCYDYLKGRKNVWKREGCEGIIKVGG